MAIFLSFLFALAFLAFGPQAAHSLSISISQVEQCAPVWTAFSGKGQLSAAPVRLTLLPFDSYPVSIPVPNASVNSTGVSISFLPLAAGTTFVAFFEDASGNLTGQVTDVLKVLPSTTGDASCLPVVTNTTPHRFTVNGTVSQCAPFNVSFDPNMTAAGPSIRAFIPNHGARSVFQALNGTGTSTYIMDAERGSQVVLLLDDGLNHPETTALLSVEGDTTSDTTCLASTTDNDSMSSQSAAAYTSSATALSPGALIGIGAGAGGVVIIVIVSMTVFICRNRRKRRRIANSSENPFENVAIEKGSQPRHQSFPMIASDSAGVVKDPPYTFASFLSPASSHFPRGTSVISQGAPGSLPADNASAIAGSVTSMDIEHILHLASIYSDSGDGPRHRPAPPPPTPPPSTPPPPPPLALPTRGHLRDPSDVPDSEFTTLSQLFPVPPGTRPARASAADSDRVSYASTSSDVFLRPSTPSSPWLVPGPGSGRSSPLGPPVPAHLGRARVPEQRIPSGVSGFMSSVDGSPRQTRTL